MLLTDKQKFKLHLDTDLIREWLIACRLIVVVCRHSLWNKFRREGSPPLESTCFSPRNKIHPKSSAHKYFHSFYHPFLPLDVHLFIDRDFNRRQREACSNSHLLLELDLGTVYSGERQMAVLTGLTRGHIRMLLKD